MKPYWLSAAALMFSAEALAHTHLASSSPADGDALPAEAKEIVLSFDGLIDTASCSAADAANRPVAALGAAKAEREVVRVPLAQTLPPGSYTLSCRYKGKDGHEMNAALKFTVASK